VGIEKFSLDVPLKGLKTILKFLVMDLQRMERMAKLEFKLFCFIFLK
jgi:hypothetical protein